MDRVALDPEAATWVVSMVADTDPWGRMAEDRRLDTDGSIRCGVAGTAALVAVVVLLPS